MFSGRALLNFTMPTLSQSGLYSCIANSSIGGDSRNIRVVIRGENICGQHYSSHFSLTHQTHLLTHSLTHSPAHLLAHSCTHSLTYQPIHLLTHSPTHSLTPLMSSTVLAGVNETLLGSQTLLAGSDLLLSCGSINPREVMSLTWRREDGSPLPRDAVTANNGSLYIPSLEVDDRAVYACHLDTGTAQTTLKYNITVAGMGHYHNLH